MRKGANLYTDSIVALDAKTGAMQWFVQMTPHDVHDWDMSAPPVLFSAGGKAMAGAASKDGHLYGIDLATHAIVYDRPEVRVSDVASVPTIKGTHMCPGALGGSEWSGPAFDVKDNLLITPMDDWCATYILAQTRYIPGQFYFGGTPKQDAPSQARGRLTATDPATGAIKWQYASKSPMLAGTTPTAGGVTLTGDMGGNLLVFDSATGAVAATIPTKGSIAGGVITYAIGGKQYVAATSGNISRLTWGNGGSPALRIFTL
jgi:alcohol dehydrogenase (cytochrome c)